MQSNLVFEGNRQYIAIPSRASFTLSPQAIQLLSQILTKLQCSPNWSFRPTFKQRPLIEELEAKGFLDHTVNGWNLEF